MRIPSLLLKQLYTFNSLRNTTDGIQLALKNRLGDASLTGLRSVTIDGNALPLAAAVLELAEGGRLAVAAVTAAAPLVFPLRSSVVLRIDGVAPLARGQHELELVFEAEPFGELRLKVRDAIADEAPPRQQIPYSKENDHSPEWIGKRQDFVADLHRQAPRAPDALLLRSRPRPAATSRTSSASRRCRSASPARCTSTASTPRATS